MECAGFPNVLVVLTVVLPAVLTAILHVFARFGAKYKLFQASECPSHEKSGFSSIWYRITAWLRSP